MAYSRIYVFVEGNDDVRFFEWIVRDKLEELFDWVKISPYANQKLEKIDGFVRSIRSMADATYLYVRDIDNAPCITFRKQQIQSEIPSIEHQNVLLAIREIESWYMAGIGEDQGNVLSIEPVHNTEDLSKEDFDATIPSSQVSRIDFMIEILKHYRLDEAASRNDSLNYLLNKLSTL